MNAVFDVGNTNTKIGFFEKGVLKTEVVFPTKPLTNFYQYISGFRFNNVLLCSVISIPEHIIHYLKIKARKLLILSSQLKLPVTLRYQNPESLGADRIALVCGAAVRYPHEDTLVISAGTCITYNFLKAGVEFEGGAISPGLQMRLQAMHDLTSALPLIGLPADNAPFIAQSTAESLQSGAVNGVIFEIEGYIKTLRHTNPTLEVLLCGGNSRFIADRLPFPVQIDDRLALDGLHKILTLNAQ